MWKQKKNVGGVAVELNILGIIKKFAKKLCYITHLFWVYENLCSLVLITKIRNYEILYFLDFVSIL